MKKTCQHHLKTQLDRWLSERIMEHLVHVQGLKYSINLCGGIQNEADLTARFIAGKRIIMESKRPPDNSSLIIRIWSV